MNTRISTLLVAFGLFPLPAVQAQTRQQDGATYLGTVTGDHVNVRSGPDANYYAVGRVDQGQTVRVLGERFGWLKIQPLPGMYSLIEKNYLDLTADGRGVVNADRVNVRAAGDATPHAYARQLKLDRGVEVRILGQQEAALDGKTMTFYKIEPPRGAFVWISADYVQRLSDEQAAREASGSKRSTHVERTTPSEAGVPTSDQPAQGTTETSQAPPAPGPVPRAEDTPETARLRAELAEIEKDLAAEFEKPTVQRDVQPLIERLGGLASQEKDRVVQRFAAIRIEQLAHQRELIETVRSLRRESRQLEDTRREFMRARADIRVEAIDAPRPFELTGELRESHVYDSPALPRRYRLVDPNRTPPRTLAYVEIPRDSDIDPDALLGRFVGIHIAQRTLHCGLVESVPIIVPAQIVVIDRPGRDGDDAGQAETDVTEQPSDQPDATE